MGNFKKYIASVLPGIFLIGYNVGTGSITAMSKSGANFGLDLLWTIAISCIITYFLMVHFAKFTSVTGQTAIQGIRDHIHPTLARFLISALSLIIMSALIGVLGIVADVLQLWSETIIEGGVSASVWAIGIAGILLLLMWNGDTAFFEKILAILVAIMGLAFIATMIIKFPKLSEIAQGLVPKLPEQSTGSDNNSLVILAGMVGTTVSTFVFIIRSQIAQEKGWTIEDKKLQHRDARVSASLMFLISAAVMITAATTLHVKDIKLNHVSEMVELMGPIAGKGAMGIFVIGIVAAGISSHLPNLLVIPWLVIDYKSEKRDVSQLKYRLMLVALSFISVTGVLFGFKPVFVLLMSQACLSIVLPITVGAIIYLSSKKSLMGNQINNKKEMVLLALVMVFALYMGYQGIQGVIFDVIG
ncbi:divalent metal cation transporter [Labilibacter sediminis]|nr:divalent metal cation transporter [Labilibacter sediminis]